MTTTDSGTETLFSDDSPCELVCSPSLCLGEDTREAHYDDSQSVNSALAPPNIQPYSGVLEKGKVLIRPIAFKPSTTSSMTPSVRFGERYGSTPILTRPGSRLTLYGSTSDLLHQNGGQSFTSDRKLRSSCPSATSSPPLAMSSLPSLSHEYAHKLVNYNSLESVRKSPGCHLTNKPSFHLLPSNGSSFTDLTPSPSDSGVSELEAALRDRDSELAYLRQTMEHNEQVIFRVYQEKEKAWEREIRRLKTLHDSRLRASAQKAQKLEQLLMMQSYQLNQDKKRLSNDLQRTNTQTDKLKQEVNALRTRLEETEWALCQKTGETSLLKTQIKEYQNEQTARNQEILQLKTDYKDLNQQLEEYKKQLAQEKSSNVAKDTELQQLRKEVEKYAYQSTTYASIDSIDKNYEEDVTEKERLKAEIKELREELSEMSLNDYSDVQPGRAWRTQNTTKFDHPDSLEDIEIQKLNGEYVEEEIYATDETTKLKTELEMKTKQFEKERNVWAQEKGKVLRYQRQLQMNYVCMYRRVKALEAELENLTIEMEMEREENEEENVNL